MEVNKMQSSIEAAIKRLEAEGERYKISNAKLFDICNQIEDIILNATPENFTCSLTGDFGRFEIERFHGYDGGIFRDFRYIRYDDDVLTEVWFNDIRVGTRRGYRGQRIKFVQNLEKILDALVQKLQAQNSIAEDALSRIKIEHFPDTGDP
jgi:hypothetical protein